MGHLPQHGFLPSGGMSAPASELVNPGPLRSGTCAFNLCAAEPAPIILLLILLWNLKDKSIKIIINLINKYTTYSGVVCNINNGEMVGL